MAGNLILTEIEDLKSKKNLDKICPKGVIICTNCGQIIYGDEKDIKNKIIQTIKKQYKEI